MDNVASGKLVFPSRKRMKSRNSEAGSLAKAQSNRKYTIKEIKTNDDELKSFLFSLGCYEGETITVVSILGENYVIAIKDARYCIDRNLAETMIV